MLVLTRGRSTSTTWIHPAFSMESNLFSSFHPPPLQPAHPPYLSYTEVNIAQPRLTLLYDHSLTLTHPYPQSTIHIPKDPNIKSGVTQQVRRTRSDLSVSRHPFLFLFLFLFLKPTRPPPTPQHPTSINPPTNCNPPKQRQLKRRKFQERVSPRVFKNMPLPSITSGNCNNRNHDADLAPPWPRLNHSRRRQTQTSTILKQ